MGSYEKEGHTPPKLTSGVKARTFGEYKIWLNEFLPNEPEKRRGVFFGCAEIAQKIHPNDFFTTDLITVQSIATALLGLKDLLGISFPLISADAETVDAFPLQARKCCDEANGVYPDSFLSDGPIKKNSNEELFQRLNSLLISNGQYQGDSVYQIANILILSGLEGFGNLNSDPLAIDQLFTERTGVSSKDYFLILFGLWTIASNGLMLNRTKIFTSDNYNKNVERTINSVIDDLSFRVDEKFDSPEYEFLRKNSGQGLAEALFIRKPLIRVSDVHYLISGHQFLKLQLTTKYLHKAFSLAREYENKKSTSFSQKVADRLEKYFRELCVYWQPSGEQHPEYEYLAKLNDKSPDHIVFEKHGSSNVVTLFQVKTKTLREKTHYGISFDELLEDIDKYAEFISKSISFLYRLNEANIKNELNPEYYEISLKILNAEKCCLIGVSPLDPEIFTSYEMRRRLIDSVRGQVGEKYWNWFFYRYSGKRWWGWHIMGLDHFEMFLNIDSKRHHFYKCFYKYLQATRVDYKPRNEREMFPSNFRSFVIKHYGKPNPERPGSFLVEKINPLYDVFDKYTDDVKTFLFHESGI